MEQTIINVVVTTIERDHPTTCKSTKQIFEIMNKLSLLSESFMDSTIDRHAVFAELIINLLYFEHANYKSGNINRVYAQGNKDIGYDIFVNNVKELLCILNNDEIGHDINIILASIFSTLELNTEEYKRALYTYVCISQ